MLGVLLEARPFRPFKSSDEYLYAMKEDLAEWFQVLYPHLRICTENFMDKLETGVALCEHANAVKTQAIEYVQKKQAKMMTKSVTGSLAQAQTMVNISDVKFFSTAKPGTFFARDNLSNFICWCRALQILDCLLFESDDLIMRKNEKHVILCLLEVARIGARFGMLAPMLIQMERQIDREIAADQRKIENSMSEGIENGLGIDEDETDSEIEDEQPMLMYGPLPQIVTNDLKSLDEMVRDLVEKCTCPTQFPMIRVSEGKYRIGDTKVLIFVRILRNHVMVRVGGGWDTLSHYLDKHDPCRCRSQHRTTQGARLVNKIGAQDLAGAQVYYDRSGTLQTGTLNGTPHSSPSKSSLLGPPMNSINRSRSRSPSYKGTQDRRSVSPFVQRKSLAPPQNRSRSPTPSFVSTHTTKLSSPKKLPTSKDGLQSLPNTHNGKQKQSNLVTHIQIPVDNKVTLKTEAVLQVSGDSNTDHSDNASEVSDEGYRSLGILPDKTKNRASIYSQNSVEDAEDSERQYSIDYEDDTNDCGLRKTQFSSVIYGENKNKTEKNISRQSSLEPSPTPKEIKSVRSRRNSMEQNTENGLKRRPSMDRSLTNLDKHKNTAERTQIDSSRQILTKLPASPKKVPIKSANNTWNGRQKSVRPSINSDTFNDPFNRSSPTRRSVSGSKYDNNGRRMSHSAATSPTKGSLKEELIEAVKNADDNETIVKEVEKLLKEYGSMNTLNDKSDDCTTRRRKDSKPENTVSRIPAPIFNRI